MIQYYCDLCHEATSKEDVLKSRAMIVQYVLDTTNNTNIEHLCSNCHQRIVDAIDIASKNIIDVISN